MDIDPTHVTLGLGFLTSAAGNVFQTWKLRAEKAKSDATSEEHKAATDRAEAETTGKAYGDARSDLRTCREDVELLRSANVVLQSAFADLDRKHDALARESSERELRCQTEREQSDRRVEALREEFERWKKEALR